MVSTNMRDLRRIFSALITPMRADESVNHESLARLVEHQIDRGVEGFYCCGSSGEALLLSVNERKQVLRTVVQTVAGRVPVVAHVGTIRTADVVELARDAETAGCDAISMIPPYYYSFSLDEVNAYYLTVLRGCDLPVIIYNIPQFTHYTFNKQNLATLFDDPQVVGVKHTSQGLYSLERLRSAYPEKIYFNGFDEMFLPALAAGANASIGTTVNIQPELFRELRACFDRGEMAAAQRLQSQINYVVEKLLSLGIFNAVKYLITLDGIESGVCRAPFKPLGVTEKKELDELHEKMNAFHVLGSIHQPDIREHVRLGL